MRQKRAMARLPAPPDHQTTPDVRLRLLRAAQAQILATGFHDTNVDQVARRAGASKQTIYSHFASKEDLFQDVLRMTMEEAGQQHEPDIGALNFADACRAYAEWVEKSAANPENLELYRANIAATVAFPALSEDLHNLRLTASSMGITLLAHPGRPQGMPDTPPERLSNSLGVLAMAGPRTLLGFIPTPDERRARQDAVVQLASGGWATPVRAAALPLALQPDAPAADSSETGGRLPRERWTRLLRIAIRDFASSGLRRTSVEEIAAAARISKMTIYKRYGNKQGLFAAAIEQAVEDLLETREPLPLGGAMRPALAAAALQQDRFAQQPAYAALLCLMITEAPTHAALVQRAWTRLNSPAQAELAARLQEWQAEGAIHLVDPTIAAEQFLLLATRGNRRLTAALPWDEQEAAAHARDVTALFCP